MSKLARTLILAATVAALNLAGTTAVAQTNDQDTPSQQELAENWKLLPAGDPGPAGGAAGPDAG